MAVRFHAAGIETPELDARRLLTGILRIEAAALLRDPDATLGPDAAALDDAAGRRQRREPVSRILGVRAFYGRDFLISPATLDPRPETETIVEVAFDVLGGEARSRSLRLLDVGTGSGCILLTLLAELPQATGLGTDISAAALDIARRNTERLGLSARADFALARSLDGICEPFDLIVSNPPYIASGAIESLDPEVREHDPRAALDGGPDGLAIYRELAQNCRGVVSGGWIAVEAGAGQCAEIVDIFMRAGGLEARQYNDLAGLPRIVAIRMG